MAMSNPLE